TLYIAKLLKYSKSNNLKDFPYHKWALGEGAHQITGDYKFYIENKNQESCTLYVYSIRGFNNLLKIGITNNIIKRKEPYYGEILYQITDTREKLSFIEFCIQHATYHLANKNIPKWNVGNFDETNMIDSIKDFCTVYPPMKGKCSGHAEVREIELSILIELIEYMVTMYDRTSKEILFDRFAIKEFASRNLH
ncbi:MAG: hypothetical protein JXQ76_04970, partial [Campylobacterales bacterium]|nr:hypothetical protein [Campylobacterales bacterium]